MEYPPPLAYPAPAPAPLTGDYDVDVSPGPAPRNADPMDVLDAALAAAATAQTVDELLAAVQMICRADGNGGMVAPTAAEGVALRLAERQAVAAEATYNLLAQLVNGLTSNPMVAAMMGGQ